MSTYNRKYYLHRKVKAAGFELQLEDTHKTVMVDPKNKPKAKTNKYLKELRDNYSYGVQLKLPL